jgi:hypothetical protein
MAGNSTVGMTGSIVSRAGNPPARPLPVHQVPSTEWRARHATGRARRPSNWHESWRPRASAGARLPRRAAGPAPAIPRLTAIGSRAAETSGGTAPLQMTAVLTTHAKALTSATPGDFLPGPGDIPVFLVTIRGRFTASAACLPPGAAAPAGTYPSIVVDARTFQVLDSGLSPSPPPVPPASLGPVTYLTGHPH